VERPPGYWGNRWFRAHALVRAGDHARAAAEAAALEKVPEALAGAPYDLARLPALAVAAAQSDVKLTVSQRAALADRYAAQAMALLKKLLASIGGRYYQGILGGQGWTTNRDITATSTATGDVSIQMSGSYYFFFLQRGSYLPEPGEESQVLTLTDGAYRLQEADGTVYQFNTNGTLDYVQDANANRITASYSNGRLVQLTDSNGEYLTLGYNDHGQMISLTDSNGQTETYGYTGQFLTSYTDVYGTTTYTYVSGGTAAQNGSLAEIAYADNPPVFHLRRRGPADRPAS
jgi:YD repeat-containing protein